MTAKAETGRDPREAAAAAAAGDAFDAVVVCGASGVIESASAAVERLSGFRPQDLLGRNLDVLLGQAAKGGVAETAPRQAVGRRKDGTGVLLELAVSSLRLGGETKFIVVLRDVATPGRTQHHLMRETECLRIAAEAGALGIWESDLSTGTLTWDDRMYAMCGIAREDAGDAMNAWSRAVHPQDRSRLAAAMAEAGRGDGTCQARFRVIWPDGQVRHIESRGQRLPSDGDGTVRVVGVSRDVTESHLAETAMREATERFRTTFDQAAVGVTYLELSRRFLRVNQKFCDITGYSRDELLSMSLDDITHPDDIPGSLTTSRTELSGKSVTNWQREKRYIRKDGETIWVRATVTSINDPSGEIDFLISIIEDITERKRAEEALRASEVLFRATFEQAAVGITHFTKEGRWLRVNQKYCDILGYDRDEMAQLSMDDINHPDDAGGRRSNTEPVLSGKVTHWSREKRYIRKNGETIWVRVTVAPVFAPSGSVDYFISVIEDITGRKKAERALEESEALFRATFEQAAVGIAHVAADGRRMLVNQRYCEITGYSREELMALSPKDITHPDDTDAMARIQERLASGEVSSVSREKRYIRKNGDIIWVKVTSSQVRKPTGEPDYRISVVEDITARKEAERQLQQSLKMQAVGQLTGGIAHDFNNMLSVVLGNLDLITDDIDPGSKAQERLEACCQAVYRCVDLTQRLLAYSRQQPLRPQTVNINDLVPNVVALMHRTLGEHIDIESALAAGLWNVAVDPAQFENAVLNLAINSRDAMPDGGRLLIATENVWLDDRAVEGLEEVAAGQYVLMSVTDTGTGMPPEVVERAFEPFFTTKDVGKGSGLGLSMIYGFVKQSGGHVRIDSAVGRGTTVCIYLPRAAGLVAGLSGTDGNVSGAPSGTETILVVEDEPQVREMLKTNLELIGYRVLSVENGPAAVALLGDLGHLDMVLTDMVMPGGMNGRQVADCARYRFPHVRVLYTSGYDDGAHEDRGGPDAGAELLVKPYTRATLAQTVRRLLDAPPGGTVGAS